MVNIKALKESGHFQLDMSKDLAENRLVILSKILFRFKPRSHFYSHLVLSCQTYDDNISTGEVIRNLDEFNFAWYTCKDLNKGDYVQSFWIVPASELGKYFYGRL